MIPLLCSLCCDSSGVSHCLPISNPVWMAPVAFTCLPQSDFAWKAHLLSNLEALQMRIKEAEKRPPQHMFLQKIWELKLRGNMHRECPWRDHSFGMILDNAIPGVSFCKQPIRLSRALGVLFLKQTKTNQLSAPFLTKPERVDVQGGERYAATAGASINTAWAVRLKTSRVSLFWLNVHCKRHEARAGQEQFSGFPGLLASGASTDGPLARFQTNFLLSPLYYCRIPLGACFNYFTHFTVCQWNSSHPCSTVPTGVCSLELWACWDPSSRFPETFSKSLMQRLSRKRLENGCAEVTGQPCLQATGKSQIL